MNSNFDYDKIKERIKFLLSEKRYQHCVRVADEAVKLAEIHGLSVEKAYVAGLLHDCARNMSAEAMKAIIKEDEELTAEDYKYPEIIHGFAGAIYARNIFRIEDIEILKAIKYHTVGRKNMTGLEKVIYLADWTEPERKGKEIDQIRETSKYDIDRAVLLAISNELQHLLAKNRGIHLNTIKLRNEIVEKVYKK